MKLSQVKEKIDNYFNNLDPNELVVHLESLGYEFETISEYDYLISMLKANNYNLLEEDTSWSSTKLRVCKVTGHGIEARFSEYEPKCYMGSLNGKICADRKGSWNKARQCDIQLNLPKTYEQFLYLLEQLKYLGSSQYRRDIQNNNFLTVKDYPRKIK